MNDRPTHRRPATFKLDDPHVVVMSPDDDSRAVRGTVQVVPEPEPAALPVPRDDGLLAPPRGFRWGTLFWSSLGGLVLLGAGLGLTNLVEDLFNRSQGLGFLGLAVTLVFVVALIAIVGRELIGHARLATIEKLHARAEATLASDDRAEAQAIVDRLAKAEFPVSQLAIIGNDLKMVERVTGRLTYGRAALTGSASGACATGSTRPRRCAPGPGSTAPIWRRSRRCWRGGQRCGGSAATSRAANSSSTRRRISSRIGRTAGRSSPAGS